MSSKERLFFMQLSFSFGYILLFFQVATLTWILGDGILLLAQILSCMTWEGLLISSNLDFLNCNVRRQEQVISKRLPVLKFSISRIPVKQRFEPLIYMTFKLPLIWRFMWPLLWFGVNANYNHCFMIMNRSMERNERDLSYRTLYFQPFHLLLDNSL